MRALAVVRPGRVACLDLEDRGTQGAVVDVEAVIVGIGEVRAIRGERRSRTHDQGWTYPHVLGFAGVGRLRAVDDETSRRDLRPGDRVVLSGVSGCGTCGWCARGAENLCDTAGLAGIDDPDTGLMRERVRVPGRLLYRIGDAVDYRVATLASEVGTCVRAVRRSGLRPGETLAVFGLGVHGMHACQLARALGAGEIHGVDPDPGARASAKAAGVTRVFTPEEYASWLEPEPDRRPERVLHFTSGRGSIGASVRAVAPRGVVVAGGTPDEEPVMIPEYYRQIIIKEATIVGLYSTTRDDWTEAIGRIEAGAVACPTETVTVALSEAGALQLESVAAHWPVRVRHYVKMA